MSEAFSAVWEADNDRAIALLHNVDEPGCAWMRARIWFRVKRFDRVLGEYERRELRSYAPQEANGLACSAAFAHAVLGDELQAQRALDAARAASARSHDPLLKIQNAYASARIDLMTGNVERSRRALDQAASVASSQTSIEPRTHYQLELNHLRARIQEFQGRHRALEGDLAGREECYVGALLTADAVRHRDRWFEANLLAMLAETLAIYPAHRVRHYVLSRSVPFLWNSHLDTAASLVKRGLRNNRRLFGFDESVETIGGRTAPSLAARLGERVDALLLDEWQNHKKFFDEMRFAVSIAHDVDWTTTSQGEATHLLRLAVLLAPYEPLLAQKLGNRYAARMRQRPERSNAVNDLPREMLEVFLDGCLAKAGGDALAEDKLRCVMHFWRNRNLVWAAAIAGIERFTIGRDQRDLAPAREFLAEYPKTTFSRRLSRALDRAKSSGRADFAYLGLYGTA